MKKIAVILARGGSKGIPNKNLINLDGKPLIYYTINAAQSSNFDEVWVNTDSEEIMKYSESLGTKIFERPLHLATDLASSDETLVNFCENVVADIVAMIQPTSPLLKGDDLDKGLEMMNDYDSIFSGHYEHWIPKWNRLSGKLIEKGWQKEFRNRRQDISAEIVENGAFYMSHRKFILMNKLRYFGKIGFFEMPYVRSFQVDDLSDLFIIESLIKNNVYLKY